MPGQHRPALLTESASVRRPSVEMHRLGYSPGYPDTAQSSELRGTAGAAVPGLLAGATSSAWTRLKWSSVAPVAVGVAVVAARLLATPTLVGDGTKGSNLARTCSSRPPGCRLIRPEDMALATRPCDPRTRGWCLQDSFGVKDVTEPPDRR